MILADKDAALFFRAWGALLTWANAGGEAATASDGAKVVCHLSCSGTEATGQGATEEEARADVSQHIEANCKPEDGQYFVFCDPPQ